MLGEEGDYLKEIAPENVTSRRRRLMVKSVFSVGKSKTQEAEGCEKMNS